MKQKTLNCFGGDLKRELNLARRRAQYALKNNMAQSVYHPDKRPRNTAAHHLVALTGPRAQVALQILTNFNISANGVDLPRYEKNRNHKSMPNAIAHGKTHTNFYFANVETIINKMFSAVAGKPVKIHFVRTGRNKLDEYMTYTLDNCIPSYYSFVATERDGCVPVESLELSYSALHISRTSSGANNKSIDVVRNGYDLARAASL